jgi:hypothetical protein
MNPRRVSIDLEIAMSPFAMAAIISGLRSGQLAEVHVPDNLRFIEVGTKFMMPDTLRLLDQSPEELREASEFFGFSPDQVEPENPFAGLYLLARAWREGLFKELDTFAMSRRVASEFGDGKVFPDFYRRTSPTGSQVELNPDLGGATLEGLIGHSLEGGISPIFGDRDFLMYFTKKAEALRMGRLVAAIPSDPNVTKLQDFPGGLSMEALYKLSADPEFAKLLPHIAVPTPYTEGGLEAGEVVTELGAVVVDHFTHSMYAGLGRVAYKIWRAVLAR